MTECFYLDNVKMMLSWKDMQGIAIDKKDKNSYVIYTMYEKDNKINYLVYRSYDNINDAENFINEKMYLLDTKGEEMFTCSYAHFPKSIIIGIKIFSDENKYLIKVLTEQRNEFLVSYNNDKNKSINMFEYVRNIIRENVFEKDTELSVSSVCLPDDPAEIPAYEESLLQRLIVENKKKKKNIELDETPLIEIDNTRIDNFEIFSKIVEDVINEIEINEDCGTTLIDVSRFIRSKLNDHKGKILTDPESDYILYKLREKFPGRLYKRPGSYGMYDISKKKHTTCTTVFGGLLFNEHPKLLSGSLRK